MAKRKWRDVEGELTRLARAELDDFNPATLPAHVLLAHLVSRCPACYAWLPKGDFYVANRRDGTSTYCREHQKQYQRLYRRRRA
jgi:hypothetical protein